MSDTSNTGIFDEDTDYSETPQTSAVNETQEESSFEEQAYQEALSESSVFDDEEFFGGIEDFGGLNFDAATPPDGKYYGTIREVEFRKKYNEEKGHTTVGLFVWVQLEAEPNSSQAIFNGMSVTDYIWLGNDRPHPMGIRQFANFVQAVTGSKPSGNVNWREYGLDRKQGIGNKMYLTFFEGLPVTVDLVTQEENGQERTKVKSYSQATGPFDGESDEPF